MRNSLLSRIALGLLLAGLTPTALWAQDVTPAAAPTESPATTAANSEDGQKVTLGIAFDVGVASMYIFRGLNVFAASKMADQHGFVAPSLTWTGLDGALAIGYWGAYQVVGDNIGAKLDAAAGAENDLTVAYTHKVNDQLSVVPGGIVYLYPLADEKVAGTSLPTVVEPAIALNLATAVDVSVKISYFYAVQKEIEAWRYIYLNPSASKTVPLNDTVGLQLLGSLGYKAGVDFDSNTKDVMVMVAAPVVLGSLTVKPGLNLAWTNLEGLDLGDEIAVFGSVNISGAL